MAYFAFLKSTEGDWQGIAWSDDIRGEVARCRLEGDSTVYEKNFEYAHFEPVGLSEDLGFITVLSSSTAATRSSASNQNK